MNLPDEEKPQFVFTLSEDSSEESPSATAQADENNPSAETKEALPDWEQRLEQLRRNKKHQPVTDLPGHDIFHSALSQQAAAANLAHTLDNISMRTGRPAFTNNINALSNRNSVVPHVNNEALLDSAQREQVYRAYLQAWQQRTNLEEQQRHEALNDTAVLLQEDWLAAQNCLTKADNETPAACTIQLKHHQAEVLPEDNGQQSETDTNLTSSDGHENGEHADATDLPSAESPVADSAEPVIHVHLHVLAPQGAQGRAVTCLSEETLLQQLAEKLRPHLADAMSGMVRMAIQKQTAHLVSGIQQQLLDEIPETVDEVLRHHLHRAMQHIKKSQYGG